VRYFFLVPVVIMTEPFTDWVLDAVVGRFRSGLVPETHRQLFEANVAATQRLATSDAVALTIAVIALSLPHVLASDVAQFLSDTTTWASRPGEGGVVFNAAGRWYAWVSLPFVQFLLLRWAWRILLWSRLLWRTSRMPLTISPGHPDRMGGLEVVSFAPFAFVAVLSALSALASAGSADAIALHQVRLIDVQGPIAAFVILELLVLLVPQLFFVPAAERARLRSLTRFAAAGEAAAQAFKRHWADAPTEDQGVELLESNQPGAMADFSVTYAIVQKMRPTGLSIRTVLKLALLLVAPFIPLLLFEYSVRDILQQVLQMFR
jgi:hypothetical protein